MARSVLRHRPRLVWSDAAGEHGLDVVDRMLVGSSPDVAAVLVDRAVSRLHAQLELHTDGVWIRDLGSRNGTFVEGLRVTQALVPEGGRIVVGKTTLTVQRGGEPARVPLWPHDRFGPLVGRSELMRELFMRLSEYAASDATVLVQGETGTGKELVAEALHGASERSEQPFVVVDCGALPESLLESELFGHARGAFTGAIHARAGAIESAHGGTLFLDEIGELPLSMQPKLLRAIEAKSVRRIGESDYRPVDVRVVAATHRDLQGMVAAGAFREDLYFRLSVLPVTVPPLRARPEDVAILFEHFVGAPAPAAIVTRLAEHPFIGNVRELRNLAERVRVLGVERAMALSLGGDPALVSSLLPPPPPTGLATPTDLPAVRTDVPFKELREQWLDHLERGYMVALIATHSRNVTAIAEAAGLDRTYVHRLLRKHDL